jgi:hypothetical protein
VAKKQVNKGLYDKIQELADRYKKEQVEMQKNNLSAFSKKQLKKHIKNKIDDVNFAK